MSSSLDRPLLFAKPMSANLVIGVDEAGRGPLAGPVVAAACVLGAAVPAGVVERTDDAVLATHDEDR